MNPEAQRIAIAEACPKVAFIKTDGVPYWRYKEEPAYDSDRFVQCEFDPLNDLNAMHEAEKVLTDDQWFKYWLFLGGDWNDSGLIGYSSMLHATAAQRAEAFLRTIGKWEDSQ